MNQARHRAGAHLRIETFFREVLAQSGGKFHFHFFLKQLLFQLQQEFVHHFADDHFAQRCKRDNRIQAVAEFGSELLVNRLHFIAALALTGKTNGGLAQALGAGIGSHDDDYIAEIGALSVIIGELAVVHHLQQHIENIGMGFFDFVEQQHAIRLFVHRFSEQTALLEADIARRRTNQARYGVAFHIFRHIKALQRHTE